MVGRRAIRVRRETHTRCISSESIVGWEEYANARNAVKETLDKKGIREDVVGKTNQDFDGGVKQMWRGIKGIIGNRAGKIDNGIATMRAQSGKMVSSSKGKREVLVEHYRKLGTPKPS